MKNWIIATIIAGIICFIVADKMSQKSQKVADLSYKTVSEFMKSELGK